MPWPISPLVGSACQAPLASPLRPRALGTHNLSKAPTVTHTGTMMASPAHQRHGVVYGGSTSPLSLGTGQPGLGTSAAQGRMCWPAVPTCVRPVTTQTPSWMVRG